MSTISSGVGLISGLPIQELVEALTLAQRGPINQLENRLGVLTARRTALLAISAQLLSLKNAAARFTNPDFFRSATAASSNESAILASVSDGAIPGEYTFSVQNLARAHQLISAGFASADSTLVGAGTLTLERAEGLLNRSTELGSLNGGSGVSAGRIRITDRGGSSATIDLVTAQTINDVVGAINAEAAIGVTARIEGDRLVLEDGSGGIGNLTVAETGTGRTAGDLGILQSVTADRLLGSNLVALSDQTRLAAINDGNGVRTIVGFDFEVSLADGLGPLQFDLSDRLRSDTPLGLLNGGSGVPLGTIRITDRSGSTEEIDLSAAATIQDVLDAINNAGGVNVTAAISGSNLVITDNSIAEGQDAVNSLLIEDVDSTTADALGVAGSAFGSKLTGEEVFSVRTLGDVIRIINLDPNNGGRLAASISADGLGITLTDTTIGAGTFALTALNSSSAAEDLGLLEPAGVNTITSRRLLAGLNTVLLRSLNGGRGVDLNGLQITDRAGVVHTVDLSNAVTLADVIDAVNALPTISASVTTTGLGIELIDSSGGTGNLTISGVTADDLGISIDAAVDRVSSGNLQKQYISEATRLEDLNHGDGIPRGKFRITDSDGQSAVVDLTQGDEKTIQDVIDEINSRPTHIKARINDTGDGLLLFEDGPIGSRLVSVSEEGSTVARSLGILGAAAEGENFIDGSFETRIEIDGNDTLDDVLSKIRASNADVNASILNDGSTGQPFRLNLTSARLGRAGALAIDGGTTGLVFDTLARAQDATVVFGPSDGDTPLVLRTSSNTLTGIVEGVRLDLIGASDNPVTITVNHDVDGIVQQFQDFVTSFNAVISTLSDLTRFDTETETRAVLTGDSTARRVRNVLLGLTGKVVDGVSAVFNRLGSVGVSLSNGANLELDEDELRSALESNPDAVTELFTLEETDADGEVIRTGLGGIIEAEINRLTAADTGVIPLKEEALLTSEGQISDRIDQLEILLGRRRERLLAQFTAMEAVLARLQTQQNALLALPTFAPLQN